jgi:acyl-CoA thioesterase
MNVAIGTVSRRLALAVNGADRFVGYSAAGRQGRAFGGNVAAQALLAAGACVPQARFPHSLHAYFVRAAPADQSLYYVVTRLRDGGAFSVRRVDAIAGDGVCLTMTCSFVTSVTSTEHQRPDEWLLVEQESPSYASSRALCRSAFYNLAGRLVASCAQEAMMRRRVRPV